MPLPELLHAISIYTTVGMCYYGQHIPVEIVEMVSGPHSDGDGEFVVLKVRAIGLPRDFFTFMDAKSYKHDFI